MGSRARLKVCAGFGFLLTAIVFWGWNGRIGSSITDLESQGASLPAEFLNKVEAFLRLDDSAESEALMASMSNELETRIAECMVEEGFAYPLGFVTEEDSGAERPVFVDEFGNSVPDEDFVARFGYGITAAAMYVQGFDVGGGKVPEPGLGLNGSFAQMSADVQKAFLVALRGNRFDPALPEDEIGCYGEALADTDYGLIRSALSRVRLEQRSEINARLDADERLIELQRRWQDCVTSHGFKASWTPDLVDSIWQRLRELEERKGSEAEYRELLESEKAMAVVDLTECGGGPIADALYDQVRREIEFALLAENSEWVLQR